VELEFAVKMFILRSGSSDLQLAIALQQEEFEQQPQRHNSQQQSSIASSRLVTGPQVEVLYFFG
jgi:hypothetical protein